MIEKQSTTNTNVKKSINFKKVKSENLQIAILALLIVAGSLQTIQIFGLSKQVANASINTASTNIKSSSTTTSSSTSSSGSSDLVTSSLPQMVGGC